MSFTISVNEVFSIRFPQLLLRVTSSLLFIPHLYGNWMLYSLIHGKSGLKACYRSSKRSYYFEDMSRMQDMLSLKYVDSPARYLGNFTCIHKTIWEQAVTGLYSKGCEQWLQNWNWDIFMDTSKFSRDSVWNKMKWNFMCFFSRSDNRMQTIFYTFKW